ncbi:MAG: hypothetical protein P8Z31_00985 [Gammaproteobacteria bacterium]|jgi:hypothetical protein
MKKYLLISAFVLGIASSGAMAHHAADGMVDDEVYAMIDDLVADTPHSDMTLVDITETMTDMTITTRTTVQLENMIEDGLLTYIYMLDGTVTIDISFDTDGSVEMVVQQTE